MNIRPSAIAGRWYPGQPEALLWEIDKYLDQAPVKPPAGKIWGIVVPHAGYYFSGSVAAYAFNCLCELHPEIVAVISPLHSDHPAPLLTTAYEAYQTPLGLVEVDTQAVALLDRALHEHLGHGLTPLQSDREHALEIELPFLQRVLDNFRLLPVMIRAEQTSVAKALGQALAETLQGRRALLVASSDLSHFYPQPLARQLDTELLRRLQAFDPQGVMEAESEGAGFACGDAAIAAALWTAERLGANRVTILHHATSGDATGDYSSVVGYGAAVIWQENARPKKR